MASQIKNLLIGIFIIAACSLLVGIVMFLKPSVGNMEKTLYIRFANINKINVGTRVTYAGKPIGEVVAIDQIPDPRKQPTDVLGRYYFYQLTVRVDSTVVVYNTDEISLQTSGLLGEKSIAIVPKRAPKGITPKLITTQPIYANSVDPIENAFLQLSSVASKMQDTLDEVNKWMKQNGDMVACTIKNFGDAMHQIDVAVCDFNEKRVIDEIYATASSMKETVKKIQQVICDMDNQGTFTNLAATMKNVKKTTRSLELVSKDLADGKGTLGKLLKFDDLYLRFTAIMSKIDTLMDDINHYGLLFSSNKGWQREHTKRANLMGALDTPQSFKNYFQTEVGLVNNSMSRISMLIDKAEETPIKDQILSDDMFKKDFAELLRKADELSENLRLYNQQLQQALDP